MPVYYTSIIVRHAASTALLEFAVGSANVAGRIDGTGTAHSYRYRYRYSCIAVQLYTFTAEYRLQLYLYSLYLKHTI